MSPVERVQLKLGEMDQQVQNALRCLCAVSRSRTSASWHTLVAFRIVWHIPQATSRLAHSVREQVWIRGEAARQAGQTWRDVWTSFLREHVLFRPSAAHASLPSPLS